MQGEGSGRLWGGRFQKSPAQEAEAFTRSFEVDVRLWRQDLMGSLAHARMLGIKGILSAEEANRIVQGLLEVGAEIQSGQIPFDTSAEDVHSFIEAKLYEKIGSLAGKLHTGRSRNDQVVTDVRLWMKEAVQVVRYHLHDLQRVLIELAMRHTRTVMPGLTHQQHAQPVTLAHHLLAYFWMLERDFERLGECLRRTDANPLGAGALAGTSFAIDRQLTAAEMEFASVIPNSMDAVSDRDFIAEFLFACGLLMVHLSRLAQELIMWSAPEYGYMEFDDAYATGSSIMPQKKNPDIAELVRGRTAVAIGNASAMLSLLKGLPLTYNSDLQEDKRLLFSTYDLVVPALQLTNKILSTARWNKRRMRQAAYGDYSTSTELADYLARRGVPFRDAHRLVGQLVLRCVRQGKPLERLSLAELQMHAPQFEADALQLLSARQSVFAHTSEGGTAPSAVRDQIRKARKVWKEHWR